MAAEVPVAKHCRMYERLLDLLFPPTCAFCGTPSAASERQICQGCADDLPWIARACRRCAMPVTSLLAEETLCVACQRTAPIFRCAVAPLAYEFPVDAAIKAYKFRRRSFYQPAFAEVLLSVLGRLPHDIDAVAPVPLHRWRLARRGFNQARELAVPVARTLGVPLVENIRRRRATPYQSGLKPADRRANLKGAFELRRPISFRHVLIVDDVVTTGETCAQIAALLKRQGVDDVSVLAVARTVR